MIPHGDTVRRAFDLMNSGRLQQAEDLLRRHLRKSPSDAGGLHVLAATLLSRGQPAQAMFFATKANELCPRDPAILGVLGFSLASAGRGAEALGVFRDLVAIAPDDANAHVGLGVSLAAADRHDEAIPAFERAIALDPSELAASKNLAICYARLGDANAALRVLRLALKYAPHDEELLLQAASMSNYADVLSAAEARSIHDALARAIEARAGTPRLMPATPLEGRSLRVGLLSADFRDHSCSFFLDSLLSYFADGSHSQAARMSLVCFSATRSADAVTERLRAFGHAWHEVASLDDAGCASAIRAQKIDVLIDCGGHTLGSRVNVLARRAAPLQATYLGYPNTTSLRECDLRIVDSTTDPDGFDVYSRERLVRLDPHFLCYTLRQNLRDVPVDPIPPRARTGRPTFASFNSPIKIVDSTIALWAALLHAVPGAMLLLKAKHDGTKARLLRAFATKSIGADRVSVLPLLDDPLAHMALYNEVDVALDSVPYNGTTTTYEALSMGVPVVAMAGDRHASRVSMSILHAAGLPELVAHSADEYVGLAASLVADTSRLRHYRSSLRDQLATSPACDRVAFATRFAAAMHKAWDERVLPVG